MFASNTAYGSLLIDKAKHTAVAYTEDVHIARQAVNRTNFKSMRSIGGGIYEITKGKKKIVLDCPNYVGFNLLCLSKLHQLRMLYEFLHVFLDKSLFTVILSDTDSYGIECGRKTLDACVKPEMRGEFNRLLYDCCNQKDPDRKAFLPRLCCSTHISHDKRVCGLYKFELSNHTSCVALSAKCYLMGSSDNSVVIKAKGIQRPHLSIHSPLETFKRVLQKQQFVSCTNKGFREISGSVVSYELSKRALSNFYAKRVVLGPDGIFTEPLAIILNPFPQSYLCVVLDKPDLSPACTDQRFKFKLNQAVFPSILHALLVHKLYFVSDIKSYDFLKPHMQKIMSANEESQLLHIYNALPSSHEWERDLETLLTKILQARLDQHPTLHTQLCSAGSLPIVYPTVHSFILGTGFEPYVCKFHPPAAASGHNLVGKVYTALKLQSQAARRKIRPLTLKQNISQI